MRGNDGTNEAMPILATAVSPQDSLKSEAAPVQPEPKFSRLNPVSGTEIFTKLGDVKSAQISWTPERRQQLGQMWNRGDSTAAIAEVLGCKAAVVSVARARFGLTPRRKISGRPKQHQDEPAHKIERVAFTTSRLMEFCTEKELVAQTGHEAYRWPLVLIKELIDNAIDAAEEAEVGPVIEVAITTGKQTRIVIADNGPGIPSDTIAGIIDYNVRVSTKEAIISPTRGRQGNALKTILPMGYVLSGKITGETWIEARGVKHRVLFSVNQIKQEPLVQDIRSRSSVTAGTRVTVLWPSNILVPEVHNFLGQFVFVNPHLTLKFIVDGKTKFDCAASNPNWTKYRACDATSAHWYRPEQFERYAGALIARDQEANRPNTARRKITVREFIAQFRGMSATERQHSVLQEVYARHLSLARFFGSETRVNHDRMRQLLTLLQKNTRPVRPELLGVIGEEHLKKLTVCLGGEPKSFKYSINTGHDANGVPYVVEIAICPFKAWVDGKQQIDRRVLITGVNFSATLTNPFHSLRGMEGMEEILADLRAGPYAPVIVCVHYASPHIEYLDRGKSRIGLG
jgi:DNA topoisomerase VI subunit B